MAHLIGLGIAALMVVAIVVWVAVETLRGWPV